MAGGTPANPATMVESVHSLTWHRRNDRMQPLSLHGFSYNFEKPTAIGVSTP